MSGHAFGQPVERLANLARRHAVALEAGERLTLNTILLDPEIDGVTFVALARWRAIGALRAACGNSSETFLEVLGEAVRLDREGIL